MEFSVIFLLVLMHFTDLFTFSFSAGYIKIMCTINIYLVVINTNIFVMKFAMRRAKQHIPR